MSKFLNPFLPSNSDIIYGPSPITSSVTITFIIDNTMYHRNNSYQKPNAIENIRKHIFKVNQEKNNQKVDCLHSFVMFQAVYYGAETKEEYVSYFKVSRTYYPIILLRKIINRATKS